MAPGLITTNVLRLKNDIGTCQIELCVGDITKLQREDKVDVLVVSAFPGDYSPTPTSLIGQLQIQLGISVKDLSKHKEEDLRRQYFCWWSKPLPNHLSYKRVLCFEGGFGRGTSPQRVIGAIFRCLVPILKNTEGSVIMPLITTGDQGYSQELVLNQIVKAAVNWIKAGLPLRTLKIVAFSRHPDKENNTFKPLFNLFENYAIEKEPEQESFKEEDAVNSCNIFISHCFKDHSTAIILRKYLEEKCLRVFNDIQEVNDKESWQDAIYKTMVKCSCIVVLLSPDYFASESCREQYNMALFISSKMNTKVFAFGERSPYLPTYAGQIQFQSGHFRPNDETKLKEIADNIYQELQMTHNTLHQHDVQAAIAESQQPPIAFKNLTLSNNVDIPYSVQVAEEKGSHQVTEVEEGNKRSRNESSRNESFHNESSRLARGRAANRTAENAKTPTEQDEI